MIALPALSKRTINASKKSIAHLSRDIATTTTRNLAFCLALCGLLITPALAQNDEPSDTTNAAANVTQSNDSSSQSTLDLYDLDDIFYLDEDNNPFIARYQSAIEPSGLGVLLLPDENRELLNASIFFESYRLLSSLRWNTLGIFLPDVERPPAAAMPNAADANAGNGENPDQPELIQPEQQPVSEDLRRLNIAADYLARESSELAVIVGDRHQLTVLEDLAKREEIIAIVLWRSEIDSSYSELLKTLSKRGIKILDIIADTHSAEWQRERKLLFKRAGYIDVRDSSNPLTSNYTQMRSPDGKIGNVHSSRRIQHWLSMNMSAFK